MFYLHYYISESEFDGEYYSNKYEEPWCSLTENIDRVDYNKNYDGYVKFEILSNGQIKWKSSDSNITRTIEYSKNGGKWTSVTSTTGGAIINASAGDVIYFRGENESYAEVINPDYVSDEMPDPYNNSNIRTVSFDGTTCNFNLSGNIISLIKKDRADFRFLKNLSGECNFYGMFRIGGNKLKSIENLSLPATGLTNGCYAFMFTSAATNATMELPSTKMKNSCYRGMFRGCTNLTTAPELPATTLAEYCYRDMLRQCTRLTTAPELPATTLYKQCYRGMFNACTGLTTAPELPATTLAEYCYYSMFYGCTSLTAAPELPATTLADSCYYVMFKGCSVFTTAPDLPATTLARSCYFGMFAGCTSLTSAPELPATTLANNCYMDMFSNCTNLTTAPELPAATLTQSCYRSMFSGCPSLETAPKILATEGGGLAYVMENMFSGCTKLDSLICLITDFYGYIPTNNWLNGVKEPGIFYKNPLATESSIRYNEGSGGNRIPDSWTIVDYAG